MIYQYAINIAEIININQRKELMNIISKERITRANRYYLDKDKTRCIVAELLLRFILMIQYDLEGDQIKFGYTPYGKPFLEAYTDIFFNISHSGDWVVCAVGDAIIGVDVEKKSGADLSQIYRIFSKREIHHLQQTVGDEQADLFYRIWTLKESFVKNIGEGINYPFDQFSFEFKEEKICQYEDDNVTFYMLIKSNMNRYECMTSKSRSYTRATGRDCDSWSKVNDDFYFVSEKLNEMHWYALCCNCSQSNVVNHVEAVTFDELKKFFEKKEMDEEKINE